MDFAGSGVVNIVGGFAAFISTLFLGSRPNRFISDDRISKQQQEQRECLFGHNISYQVFGTLFLWFGWYGMNCGRTLAATGVMQVAGKVAVTTTLSAATCGLSVATFTRIVEGHWSVPRICDGILCGLVVISSPCNVIDCGYAILIGFIAAVIYYAGIWLLQSCKIDDPMNTFIIHGICGGWGLWSAGLFAINDTIRFGYSGYNVPKLLDADKGQRFATQIVGSLVISIWTMLNCILIFGLMHLCGVFRENLHNPNDELPRKTAIQMTEDDSEEKKVEDDGQK